MAGSLESVLAGIPFIGGYEAQREQNRRESLAEVESASRLMTVLQAARQMRNEQQMRSALQQSGGDLEKALPLLIQNNNLKGAHDLVPLLKLQQEQQLKQRLLGGNQNDPQFWFDMATATSKPEYATHGERLKKDIEEKAALGAMRSQQTQAPIAVGQAPTEQAAIQAVVAAGGKPTMIGVGGEPGADVPRTQKVTSGGALGTLVNSPIPSIAQHAKGLQARIDAGMMPLSVANSAIENLYKQEAAFLQAQGQQQRQQDFAAQQAAERVANRPESPLVSIVGPNGQPQLASREEARGKTPWVGSPDQLALKVTGGRESVYVQRMMMGANQAAKDLANVVQIPLSATTGPFGGRKQGTGLFDAGKEILANTMTPQEAQTYNAMATGFQRSLAQIESAGLMPSGSLTHQMDAVLFKAGDTNLTKLHKLAQTRQIVEAGMETIDANPRVSPEEKAKIKDVLASVRKSVPFTHSDLIRLSLAQEQNPNATLKSVLGQMQKAVPEVGTVMDGYRFKGGNPADKNNWEKQ